MQTKREPWELSPKEILDIERKVLRQVKVEKAEAKAELTEPVDPRVLARDARTAFGELLSLPPWLWYTSHTFRKEYVSPREADRHWYSWFNNLRVAAKAKGLTPSIYGEAAPFYFRVTEYQDRGTLHFHALIGNVGDIRRLLFKDFWELNGFARVEKYDPGRGAAAYVGKYLTKSESNGDIRFSHNLTKHLTKL